MVGRLARWLRILGYDTIYPEVSDAEMLRMAHEEGRVLLTRDTGLTDRKGVSIFFIESDHLEDQLGQVIRRFRLDTRSKRFTRCGVCNGLLEKVSPEAVRDEVPEFVQRTHDQFARCTSCGQIYWPGTHWPKIDAMLKKLRL